MNDNTTPTLKLDDPAWAEMLIASCVWALCTEEPHENYGWAAWMAAFRHVSVSEETDTAKVAQQVWVILTGYEPTPERGYNEEWWVGLGLPEIKRWLRH